MYLWKKHDSHGNLCWFTRRHITTFQWCQGQTQVTENEISPVLAFNQEKHPGFASSFWLRLVRHQWILDSGMSWHKKSVYVQSKLLLPSHRKPRFCSSKFGSSCESVLANSAATRFGSGGWQPRVFSPAKGWQIWPTHTASQWKRSWNFTRWLPSKDSPVHRWRSTEPSMDQMLLKNKRNSAELGISKISWWLYVVYFLGGWVSIRKSGSICLRPHVVTSLEWWWIH